MNNTEGTQPDHPPIAFGPVPSRRLGRSIGINHIPPKTCSYACVYCQVGVMSRLRVMPQPFYGVDEIMTAVRRKVEEVRAAGEQVDYLTFVPDGEPTLDIHLGQMIEQVKLLRIPVAVISNGSLVWRAEVREALNQADWVSLKVDAVWPDVWRRISRPYGRLRLPVVLEGMLMFAREFRGELATETMLVEGVNDGAEHVAALADFLGQLSPAIAYLGVPTRPPIESWVMPPAEEVINRAYQMLSGGVQQVELLIGYEGNAFASSGRPADDLLSITAVHPMREDAVKTLLRRAGADMQVVRDLISAGQLAETRYEGRVFYSRRLKKPAQGA